MTESPVAGSFVNIAVAESETGLGKDTLRIWERRYGFPRPARDANGDRVYPQEQIVRLRLMKRLMDRGYRPGKIAAASDEELQAIDNQEGPAGRAAVRRRTEPAVPLADANSSIGNDLVSVLRRHDASALRTLLAQQLARSGLETFIATTLPHSNMQVGNAWARGELQVFEEHLYTEQVQTLLRQSLAALPPGGNRLRVLLTTVPGERHALGLIMVEAYLALRSIATISLGIQTPLQDIVAAALAHRAEVVALSFSAAFPARQLAPVLFELRKLLPEAIAIWIGGQGVTRLPPSLPQGITRIGDLRDLDQACSALD